MILSVDSFVTTLARFALLGLQPQNPLRYRVAGKAFDVALPGRLEGEIIARHLQQQEDITL